MYLADGCSRNVTIATRSGDQSLLLELIFTFFLSCSSSFCMAFTIKQTENPEEPLLCSAFFSFASVPLLRSMNAHCLRAPPAGGNDNFSKQFTFSHLVSPSFFLEFIMISVHFSVFITPNNQLNATLH